MLMWLFCKRPERKERRKEGSCSNQDWGCVCELGAQESPSSTTASWGFWPRIVFILPLVGFTVRLYSSPLGTLKLSVPRGWSTAAANRTQTPSAALKHKKSVPWGFSRNVSYEQSREKQEQTNKEGKRRHKSIRGDCWQRAVYWGKSSAETESFLEAVDMSSHTEIQAGLIPSIFHLHIHCTNICQVPVMCHNYY